MNRNNENGPSSAAVAEPPVQEPVQPNHLTLPATANGNQPYVPQTDKKQPALKENAGVLLAGAGIVIALGLIIFGRIPHQPSATSNRSLLNSRQQATQSAEPTRSGTSSLLPINDAAHPQEAGTQQSSVGPDEIGRTAKQRQQPAASNLGSIAPFNNPASWDAGPYQPGVEPTPLADTNETTESKNEREAIEKPSLVFVKSAQASPARTQESAAVLDLGIGLPPGTRLRARLESTVNTAVQTPVVAVVEYNYEQNGEIIVPAGAKVFGHLEAADRTGYIGVRFDSMMMPDGASVSMEGAATDLQLRPLRGRVEGKHAGKNILVRSAAGVGEIVGTLAGRGSLNQPLSEGDLLRERVSNNIAQASDEEVNKLAVTERLVVSVPADTEIYVVLLKMTKALPVSTSNVSLPQAQGGSRQSAEQLRQLLQLQKELNQETNTVSSNQ
jgi:hypothetical protein